MKKRNRRKNLKILILFLVTAMCIIALFIIHQSVISQKNSSDFLEIPFKSQVKNSEQSSTNMTGVNDLTGLPLAKENQSKRPLAVMINNIEQAQPLLGVSEADIIYECLVEGAITRLMAVFKDISGIKAVGSIRSARAYFINIANGLNCIYFHAGGSEQALNMINNGAIDAIDLNSRSDLAWRDDERRINLGFEHSLISSGENILEGVDKSLFRKNYLDSYISEQKFSDTSPTIKGEICNNLNVKFSWYKTTEFSYDKSMNTYKISQFSQPQVDGNSNIQNCKPNVIAIYVNTYQFGDSILQQMDLVGDGKGYYANKGKIIPIKWSRKTLNSPFKYTLENGADLVLAKGQSYVCCVPFEGSITYS